MSYPRSSIPQQAPRQAVHHCLPLPVSVMLGQRGIFQPHGMGHVSSIGPSVSHLSRMMFGLAALGRFYVLLAALKSLFSVTAHLNSCPADLNQLRNCVP